MANKTLTIEQRIARLEAAVFSRKGKTKSAAETKPSEFSGATGGVRFLISKGFFKKKKALAEIRTALSDHGYHYSAQSVHEALKRLTAQSGPLVSLKEGGRKVYAERK
jgi:hypothetical protein